MVDLFSLYRRVVTQLPHRDANFNWHRHVTNALKCVRCFQACAEMIVSRRKGHESPAVLNLCLRIELAKTVLRCILYGLRMEINCNGGDEGAESSNSRAVLDIEINKLSMRPRKKLHQRLFLC